MYLHESATSKDLKMSPNQSDYVDNFERSEETDQIDDLHLLIPDASQTDQKLRKPNRSTLQIPNGVQRLKEI